MTDVIVSVTWNFLLFIQFTPYFLRIDAKWEHTMAFKWCTILENKSRLIQSLSVVSSDYVFIYTDAFTLDRLFRLFHTDNSAPPNQMHSPFRLWQAIFYYSTVLTLSLARPLAAHDKPHRVFASGVFRHKDHLRFNRLDDDWGAYYCEEQNFYLTSANVIYIHTLSQSPSRSRAIPKKKTLRIDFFFVVFALLWLWFGRTRDPQLPY